jgi:hypothetical protein
MNDERILDCGHKPSMHGTWTTGTAHTTDGREICWECADKEIMASLLTEDKIYAYLDKDEDGNRSVITWTGGHLAKVYDVTGINAGFCRGSLSFNATDVHGQEWYGRGGGWGVCCWMKKKKKRS